MNQIELLAFSGDNDTQKMRNAVDYLRKNPGTKLVVPEGEYCISDPKAVALQVDVMSGKYGSNPEDYMFSPECDHATGLDFSGLSNVEISAYGAVFMIDGFMETINIANCENVTLKGITIDHRRKPYTKGIIVAAGKEYTDIKLEEMEYTSPEMPSPRIAVFGKDTRRIEKITASSKKQWVSGNVMRFYGFSFAEDIGCEIYIWHSFHFRPAIHIYQSNHTIIEDVTIHSHPGMGIVGQRSNGIFLKRLKVVPSIKHKISTNTDATHFISCRGKLVFDGCMFEGHGDDATNVHVYYYNVNADAKGHKLKVEVPTHNARLDYPEVGDVLELSKTSELIPLSLHRVTAVTLDFENWCCYVSLDKPLPENLSDYYLANTSALPELTFANCVVKNHIARGVLVKTRNVLIENCLFEYTTGTAIHIAAEGAWHEGIGAENVVVRGNRIVNCGGQGWGRIYDAGGISINILSDNPKYPVHKNILIENNIIDCPDTLHAVYVANVDGLVIKNNQLNCAEAGNEVKAVCVKSYMTSGGLQ